jgi:hypothetical protein
MLKSINKTIIIKGGINQVPQCVRRVALCEVKMSCQHIDFSLSWKELRLP